MRKLIIASLAVAVFLTVATVASADHSWGGYHWARTSNPFTLQLENDLTATSTSNWPATLDVVSGDWSASEVLDTQIVNYAATSKKCDPITGKVRVCNRKYGFNGWLGVATIWISGSHIVQGTVKVNDSYFNTTTYNDANAKRHVLCQEVGHTLGLDHQRNVSDSCMNDQGSTLFLSTAVSPNQHDYDELAIIYGHLDGSTTVSSAAGAPVKGRSAEGPSDDGLPPGAGPEDGTVFVHDLGGGQTAITFVVWAEPRAAGTR